MSTHLEQRHNTGGPEPTAKICRQQITEVNQPPVSLITDYHRGKIPLSEADLMGARTMHRSPYTACTQLPTPTPQLHTQLHTTPYTPYTTPRTNKALCNNWSGPLGLVPRRFVARMLLQCPAGLGDMLGVWRTVMRQLCGHEMACSVLTYGRLGGC